VQPSSVCHLGRKLFQLAVVPGGQPGHQAHKVGAVGDHRAPVGVQVAEGDGRVVDDVLDVKRDGRVDVIGRVGQHAARAQPDAHHEHHHPHH